MATRTKPATEAPAAKKAPATKAPAKRTEQMKKPATKKAPAKKAPPRKLLRRKSPPHVARTLPMSRRSPTGGCWRVAPAPGSRLCRGSLFERRQPRRIEHHFEDDENINVKSSLDYMVKFGLMATIPV
jgi:hypothetical protein